MNAKCYILIHGAWHARWCWKYITPLLERQGHEVIAPDLPGHGDNFFNFKNINLETYVNFVTDLGKNQNKPVILVGHSMAGVIISQVAENIDEQIDKLIYIAAFIPKNKSSLILEARKSIISDMFTETFIDKNNHEIVLKNKEHIKNIFYNYCNIQDTNFAINSLQKEPFKPFIDSIKITEQKFGKIKKLYVECLYDQAVKLEDQKRMQARINCEVASLQADHSPFFSAPEELTDILISCNN